METHPHIKRINDSFKKAKDTHSMEYYANIRNCQVLMFQSWPAVFDHINDLSLRAFDVANAEMQLLSTRKILKAVMKNKKLECMCQPKEPPCLSCKVTNELKGV